MSSAIHLPRTASLLCAIYLQKTAVLILCYSFANDCCPSLVLFIFKGLLSLSCGMHVQRTAVLVLCYAFAKDCGPCLMLFICKGLRPCLMLYICKGLRGPCSLLFICKGLWSLTSAIHSQKLWSLLSAIHLQRTAVLDFCYSFTKDCGPYLPDSVAKDCCS